MKNYKELMNNTNLRRGGLGANIGGDKWMK